MASDDRSKKLRPMGKSEIARSVARRTRLLARTMVRNVLDSAFWSSLWLQRISRRPLPFTDVFGVTLLLHSEDAVRHILTTRLHFDDEPVLQYLLAQGRQPLTVLDVGANYGQFALFAFRLLGRGGQVHSFEPGSYAYGRLCENIEYNSATETVRANRCAVGRAAGTATLYAFAPSCSAWNSLSYHAMRAPGRWVEPSSREEVEVVTLDEYCADHGIEKIDVLKIDVEGLELDVLRGASRLIAEGRIGTVVFEISLEPLKALEITGKDVLRTISEMGFDVHCLAAEGKTLSVLDADFQVPHFANYVATPLRREETDLLPDDGGQASNGRERQECQPARPL